MLARQIAVAATLFVAGATMAQAQMVNSFEDISGQVFLGALGQDGNSTAGSVANRFATISQSVGENVTGNVKIDLGASGGQFDTIGTTAAGALNQSAIELSGTQIGTLPIMSATSVAGSLGAMTGALNTSQIAGNIDLTSEGNFKGAGAVSTTVVGALNSSS
ncbi:hypothetical protein, partial [Cereibacter changlensis]